MIDPLFNSWLQDDTLFEAQASYIVLEATSNPVKWHSSLTRRRRRLTLYMAGLPKYTSTTSPNPKCWPS